MKLQLYLPRQIKRSAMNNPFAKTGCLSDEMCGYTRYPKATTER